ncbi:MAG: serine hydrolase domain-containing protein [Burkholderiales bacterium]|jgi:CubicO group peptidase (beta-lactamase class C family)|nr:beta-lactamase family protein [Betaproteobacteria bacterium]
MKAVGFGISMFLVCALVPAQTQTQPRPSEPSPALFAKPLPQWSQAEREWGFRNWDLRANARPVRKGNVVRMLPVGPPVAALAEEGEATKQLAAFTKDYQLAGLLVLQDGKIRLERYALGHTAESRWTSFSVAKSVTSLLVGAAVKDGFIKSLDDPITQYIKGLRASGYDGVTVRQLLTMTTGVAWNEDYSNPNADVYKLFRTPPSDGLDATTSYMRTVKRNTTANNKWLYNTGETNLLGILVREATQKPLAVYASEKIWAPFGMEQDANWSLDVTDAEVGGCCLQATTRDFGRIGQFVLEGARVAGKSIVPEGYLEAATKKQADIGAPGRGYGYQWWTRDDGTFDAVGIHGQLIHIDRNRKLVIVMNSAWPRATGTDLSVPRNVFIDRIKAMLDAEQK